MCFRKSRCRSPKFQTIELDFQVDNESNHAIMMRKGLDYKFMILHVEFSRKVWFACVDYGVHGSDSSSMLEVCLNYSYTLGVAVTM